MTIILGNSYDKYADTANLTLFILTNLDIKRFEKTLVKRVSYWIGHATLLMIGHSIMCLQSFQTVNLFKFFMKLYNNDLKTVEQYFPTKKNKQIQEGMSSINSTSSSSTTGTSYSKGSTNSRPSSSTSGTSYTSGLINSRSSSSTTIASSTSSTASSRSFSCNDIMPGNSFNRIFPNSTADSRITGSHQTMTGIHYLGAFYDI